MAAIEDEKVFPPVLNIFELRRDGSSATRDPSPELYKVYFIFIFGLCSSLR